MAQDFPLEGPQMRSTIEGIFYILSNSIDFLENSIFNFFFALGT